MTEPRFPNARRPSISVRLRDDVAARDGGHCVYCGALRGVDPRRGFVLDHVFPFAQGGSTSESNLVLACEECNAIAGDRVFPELLAKAEWIRRAREALEPHEIARLAKEVDDDDRW